MVQINFAQRSVNVKIVYYGPGMSGKTTNLEVVHQRAPEANRGELTSISTDGDRTLFFDFMPLDLGTVAGMRTQFQLYTVPGQVYYNSTRKLVLQGVDGVIFIADSSAAMLQENIDSLRNLQENLLEYGKSLETMPWVIQYNKRDLPDALPLEELQRVLNPLGIPAYEAVANTGQGVFPTLKSLAARVLESIHSNGGLGSQQAGQARPAAAANAGSSSYPQPAMPSGANQQAASHAHAFAPAGAGAKAPQAGSALNYPAQAGAPGGAVAGGFPQPAHGFDVLGGAPGANAGRATAGAGHPAQASGAGAAPPLESTALRLRLTNMGGGSPLPPHALPAHAPAAGAAAGARGQARAPASHQSNAPAPSRAPAPGKPNAQSARKAAAAVGSAPSAKRAPRPHADAGESAAPAPSSSRLKPRAPLPTPKSGGSKAMQVLLILVGLAVVAGALIAKFVFNVF